MKEHEKEKFGDMEVIESKKIGYYYIYLFKKERGFVVQKSKFDYHDELALPYMFEELYFSEDLEETNNFYNNLCEETSEYVNNITKLDEYFANEKFMKNNNLTKGNLNVDLPPELKDFRIQEITKCLFNPEYFIENYYFIISPKFGKGLITMYDKQRDLLNCMIDNNRVVTLASRQVGKCVCNDSKIRIRNKKTGIVEEITIGEFKEKIK